jgi:hypothetical protein
MWLAGAAVQLGASPAVASSASGDLGESIAHLARAWRAEEATVAVDPTRFLNDNETVSVVLPELAPAECTTVALVGARGLGFHVRIVDGADTGEARIASQAGALAIERCGLPPPRAIMVTADSGRGALEVAVARSHRSLARLRTVLPERAGGDWLPGPEPGPAPSLPAPERRADAADARARRDGATIAGRVTLPSAPDGSGGVGVTLDPGCHTLRLFPVDPRGGARLRGGKVDLDAELRGRADDHVLARDRSDAPDADLSVCVGEPTETEVLFAGSPPRAPVLMAHYAWPLPAHLPGAWDDEVRGRMARVLFVRHVEGLPREPSFLTQGGSGTTPVPLDVEPGACYLAVVVGAHGSARALGLRVRVAAREAYDDRGIDGAGAAVAFCTEAHRVATAVIEAHGAPLLGWAFALYRVEDRAWESPR